MSKNSNMITFDLSSGETLSVPESKRYDSKQGNWTMCVQLAYAEGLDELYDAMIRLEGYEPSEAVNCILSGEELASRRDPNHRTDYYAFALPELDTEIIDVLDKAETEKRFAQFVSLCRKAGEPEMMELMLKQAVKKKNGSLHKNRVNILAAMPVVFGQEMEFYQLCTKALDDTNLEVIVRRCRFSGDEWEKSACALLNDTAATKKSGSAEGKKIKLTLTTDQDKIEISLPVVQTEDGRHCLDTLPHRALSDFNCLTGNDEKGYAINIPIDQSLYSIDSNGLELSVYGDLKTGLRQEPMLLKKLAFAARYIRTKDKKLRKEFEEICFKGASPENIPERYLDESFIAEYAFCYLCCLERKNEILSKGSSYAQAFADDMERDSDGWLCTEIPGSPAARSAEMVLADFAPGRKKPLVYLKLRCLVTGPRELEWCAEPDLCSDDSWTGFDPNCEAPNFPEKRPLVQKLNKSSAGKIFDKATESEKLRWMKKYGHLLETPTAEVMAGKTVVFNNSSANEKLEKKLTAMGAVLRKSVSGKTDYLIVAQGYINKDFLAALELKKSGKNIKFVLDTEIDKIIVSSKVAASKSTTAKVEDNKDYLVASKTLKEYTGNDETIVIPLEATKIGVGVFERKRITSVKLHPKVKTISRQAFRNCLQLQKAELPEGLETIGPEAFWGSGLREISIPDTVVTVSASAFSYCHSLSRIHIGTGVKEIGIYAFAECEIEKLCIPSNVRKICVSAFSKCFRLKELKLNEGLEEIDRAAFEKTEIVDVTIPKSVKTLAGNAFSDCRKLNTVRIQGEETVIEGSIDIIPKAKFIVPSGSAAEKCCIKLGAKFECI